MSSILLLLFVAASSYLPQLPPVYSQKIDTMQENIRLMAEIMPTINATLSSAQSIDDINLMLHNEAPTLNPQAINKVIMTLKCASEYNVDHHNILTIIDYSMPSNEKRFWVFDLKAKKLLFNTYVSHGIKSGALVSNYFSNKNNSKASSIGVYQTEQAYYGRDGLSLRLDGLDRNFNDNASNRSVVMHSGWYVEEQFIKKYGRPGRSWGCPALPLQNSKAIINTIKDKSLLVVYYPSDAWFSKSRFLNCDKMSAAQARTDNTISMPTTPPDDQRDTILFVGSGYKGKRTETYPVAVISANRYQSIFHTKAPLSRMLRRQISNEEYIALSASELNYLANNSKVGDVSQADALHSIHFVIPEMKVVRGGYYETQMVLVNLGKIKEVKTNGDTGFTVYFDGKSAVNLNPSKEFIRWVGL